jgi:hypothetical protein
MDLHICLSYELLTKVDKFHFLCLTKLSNKRIMKIMLHS